MTDLALVECFFQINFFFEFDPIGDIHAPYSGSAK